MKIPLELLADVKEGSGYRDECHCESCIAIRALEAALANPPAGAEEMLLEFAESIPAYFAGTKNGILLIPGIYAVRCVFDPPVPKVLRPWRLLSGRLICGTCEEEAPPGWLHCSNSDCSQYHKPWGKPIDLPGGEEVEG